MQFVRTLGQRTHDDQEFERHTSLAPVRRKLKIFRIVTCLMGLVKLLIFRCADLPNAPRTAADAAA